MADDNNNKLLTYTAQLSIQNFQLHITILKIQLHLDIKAKVIMFTNKI